MQVTDKQMELASSILKIWAYGKQKGFVFISSGYRSEPNQKGCDKNTWQDKAFRWPDDKDLILPFVKQKWETDHDVYWSLHKFSQPRRKTEHALPSVLVHSDLDEALPPQDLPPTLLWESSPKRYAGVWLLDRPLPVEEFEGLCRQFNYNIGADKNGWTITKVLRVPGGVNRKYDTLPVGRILHFDKHRYSADSFGLVGLPEPRPEVDDLSDIAITRSLLDYISEYKKVLTKDQILKLLMTEEQVAAVHPDRSGALYALEHELYKTGIPVPVLINMLKESGFNKYRGRKDEDHRWASEFDKIVSQVGIIVPAEDREKPQVLSLADRMSRNIEPPGWLIEGFWPVGSHGIIAGPPKSYKSILVMEMGLSIASGTALFGKYPIPHPGTVLYIQNENPDWSVDDRIRKMLAYKGIETVVDVVEIDGKVEIVEKPLPFYSVDYNLNLTNEQDKQWLLDVVRQYQPKFLILDSLYMMMVGVDENSMKEVAPMMNWLLHSVVRPFGCAIAVLHHWNKNSKGDRSTRMLGSQAFRAWVDSQISTDVDDEEQHTVMFYREFPRSYGTLPPLKVQFIMGEPGSNIYKPVIIEEAKPLSTSQEDIRGVLLERLDNGPKGKRDLMRGFEKVKVTFEGELQTLVNEGVVELKQRLYHYINKEENK